MKERWNRIRTGVWVVVFAVIGVVEYIQLMQAFDIPQVILVMPVVGALSFILLQKAGFLVPAATAVLASVVQAVSGSANAVGFLQTNAASVVRIILYVLPICLLFELIGMGAGALIRVLINRRCHTAVGAVCLAAGLALMVGPYMALYRNPLYPIQARMKLNQYVEENYNDYKISDKKMYFDLNRSSYQCRVIMADSVVRVAFLEADGTVTDGAEEQSGY